MTGQRRECDLADPVADWMESQGLRVYAEVPMMGCFVDLVGVSDSGRLVAVELKMRLGYGVLAQAMRNQCGFHLSWAAVGTPPRASNKSIAASKKFGVGLLIVQPSGVEVVHEPEEQQIWQGRIDDVLDYLSRSETGRDAGHPTNRNRGPAQNVFDQIQKYLREHPGATWDELYREIPNHYSHPRSMQGAMRRVRDVRARRAS